jgi:hypothetical protein
LPCPCSLSSQAPSQYVQCRLDSMAHTKPCIACGQEIPRSSSLCSACKSYQRSWKNDLQYFAGIATLMALTITSIFWLVERVRNTFFSKEKVVLAACNNLDTGAVVVNRGDREVFISHLTLWMTGRTSNWTAPVLQINSKLEPGQFLRTAFPPGKITGAGIFIGDCPPTTSRSWLYAQPTMIPVWRLIFLACRIVCFQICLHRQVQR